MATSKAGCNQIPCLAAEEETQSFFFVPWHADALMLHDLHDLMRLSLETSKRGRKNSWKTEKRPVQCVRDACRTVGSGKLKVDQSFLLFHMCFLVQITDQH